MRRLEMSLIGVPVAVDFKNGDAGRIATIRHGIKGKNARLVLNGGSDLCHHGGVVFAKPQRINLKRGYLHIQFASHVARLGMVTQQEHMAALGRAPRTLMAWRRHLTRMVCVGEGHHQCQGTDRP
jgi:hypothetical protein